MNEITKIVNKDKDLNDLIVAELKECRTQNDATRLEYGEKAIMSMRKYERALKLAGSFMLDDQREYEQLMEELAKERKDKEYWKAVTEEYKKKHGEIDTDFLDKKFSLIEESKETDSDREATMRYMTRKLNRLGITSGNFTWSIRRK